MPDQTSQPQEKEITIKFCELKKADGDRQRYDQYVVTIPTTKGDMTGYAGAGNWNKDWMTGTFPKTVRAIVTWKKSERGNAYAQLNCPEDMKPKGQAPVDLTPVMDKLNSIEAVLREIKQVVVIPTSAPATTSTDTLADAAASTPANENGEINMEEIPF